MNHLATDPRVAVVRDEPRYLSRPPYDPSERCPEWAGHPVADAANPAFRAVRRALLALGLDRERAGTPAWSPLGDLIAPGQTVVLKPNLVLHRNLAGPDSDTACLVTHGSVIRAVADYACRALGGRGRLIIGDCPVQGADWARVLDLVGLGPIVERLRQQHPGVDVVTIDYRLGRAELAGDLVAARTVDESRRHEYVEVDLGPESLLVPLMGPGCRFGVGGYPQHRMRAAHTPSVNRYLIHRDFLHADVVLNVPKLKFHKKAVVTCALKNLVGLVGHKDYLPHFRFGSPSQGGDEFPDGSWLWHAMWTMFHREWDLDGGLRKRLYQKLGIAFLLAQRLLGAPRGASSVGEGSWHGNDTMWRTVLDINRALLYFDPVARATGDVMWPGRRYLAVVDGLVGGDQESPLAPSPVSSGVIVAGQNPVAVDTVAAVLMGLDTEQIPLITQAYRVETLPLVRFGPEAIALVGDLPAARLDDLARAPVCPPFRPSLGHLGRVERAGAAGRPAAAHAAGLPGADQHEG